MTSLLDNGNAAVGDTPWRTVLLVNTPQKLFRASDGIEEIDNLMTQAADSSSLRFLVPEATRGTMVVHLEYDTPWAVNGELVARLSRGASTLATTREILRGPRLTLRMPHPGGPQAQLILVHHVPKRTRIPLRGLAAGMARPDADRATVAKLSQWLEWLARHDTSYDLRRGLPNARLVSLSLDRCTQTAVPLQGADSLVCKLPPGTSAGTLRWGCATLVRPCTLVVDGLTPSGWRVLLADHTYPLDRWAVTELGLADVGASVHAVRFRARGTPGMLAIGEPTLTRASARVPMNLVVILLDALRNDRLGCYGYKARPTSTRLDSLLAAKGFTLFDEARSPAPYTLPSIMKIMTSRYFHKDLSPSGGALLRTPPMLAEILRANGYYCRAHTGGGVMRHAGFERGFHEYFWSGSYGKAREVFPNAEGWLGQRHEPFFLFIHTYETHLPYFDGMFSRRLERGRLPASLTGRGLRREDLDSIIPTRAESVYIQALYDDHVRVACDAVADFFARMDELHLWETTAVVILSDHGEEFGEHLGLYASHGQSLYGELVNIPLMIRIPGLPGPARVDAEVSAIDVLPTLVDAMGVEWDGPTDGVSLRPLLEGRHLERSVPVMANLSNPPVSWEAVALFGDSLKYVEVTHRPPRKGAGLFPSVTYPSGVELYHLSADAAERHNLAAREEELAGSMADSLHGAFRRALPPLVADDAATANGFGLGLLRQLEALGYAE